MTPADIARMAREALEREVLLTPKPGLVDAANTGAHRDMDFFSFLDSAGIRRGTITECFQRIVSSEHRKQDMPSSCIDKRIDKGDQRKKWQEGCNVSDTGLSHQQQIIKCSANTTGDQICRVSDNNSDGNGTKKK